MNTSESGFYVVLIGLMFFFTGYFLLADKSMAIAGNLLIIFGVLIYTNGNIGIFITRNKYKGTILFVMGLSFMIKNAFIFGFILEVCGLVIVLSERIPSVKGLVKMSVRRMFRFIR